MSYFDDASLVMIPSGYKDQKVYSVKPLDGSGDLTFSRASSATRVASNGLIEKVRTNLYPSNIGAFVGYTLGPNASDGGQVAGPTGAMNARRIVMTSTGNAFLNYTFSVPAAGTYTFSLWVRLVSGTTLNRPLIIGGTDLVYMNALPTSTWTRVYGTFTTALSGNQIVTFPFYDNIATIEYSQIQWETGDIATDYIATTSAAVSVGPVSGLPRLDYLNSTCPRLLLEPQRTNKITYSENQGPTGTNWYPSTTWTVTNNSVTSPDGYTDADTLTEDTSTGFHSSYFNATIDNSYTGTYTISAFAKYNGRLFVLSPKGSAERTYFNLQTGTVAQAGTGVTASIVNYGNGWYRCICTATFASENVNFEHMLASAVGTLQYTGNGTSGVHIWGCMAEAGSYATSYIPTLGASVTRVADAASKTGISSLIGQTEGTLFVEEYYDATAINVGGVDDTLLSTSDGTSSNLISIFHYGNGTLPAARKAIFFIRLSGATQAVITSDALPTGTYKMALAYKNNDVVAYINGVQIGTDTSATIPATSVVTLVDPITTNAATKTVNIKQALVFKTRLSNSDLATLTTL